MAGQQARAAEVAAKLSRVRGLLRERGATALVLTRVANFAWITGGGRSFINVAAEGGAAWVLITADRARILTSNIEAGRLVEEELTGVAWEVESTPWWQAGGLAGLVAQAVGGGTVLADGGLSPAVDVGATLAEIRSELSAEEQVRAVGLGADVALALEETCRAARPGETEFAIAGRLAERCLRRGVEPVVHLVATDQRVWTRRHPLPTAKPLERWLLVAVCGLREGLVLSATRLAHVGPPPDDLLRRWEAAASVDAEMIARSQPGARAGDILAAAQQTYARLGFAEEWERHHQGGLAGYASREWRAVPGGSQTLRAGQLVAWNPSVAGAKSEDTALVPEEGQTPRILTSTGDWPTRAFPTTVGLTVPRPEILVLPGH